MNSKLINIHTHTMHGGALCLVSHALGIGLERPPYPHAEGIHPWSVERIADPQALIDKMRHAPGVLAVGEIGLDRMARADLELQKRLFTAQLDAAEELALPVILHCVKAFEETMAELARRSLPAVVFHGFIGSVRQAELAAERGYCLSFGPRSLRSPRTVEALRSLPSELIFTETDDNDDTIEAMYARVAAVRGTEPEALAIDMYQNFKRIFPTTDDTLLTANDPIRRL